MENEYKMTPKVSVIIPVWNPGEGIGRCVASLRGQTLGDIEMIFVDDCGTDGAMDVVRAAAAEDPRIRIITNAENMGEGASRNAGIEAARGEYLSSVDADDYAVADFLEILYAKGHAEDLDIVKGSQIYINDDGIPAPKTYILNEGIRKGLSENRPLFYLFCYEHQSAIYHRRLFAHPGVRYGLTGLAADTTFLLKVCHAAKSFGMEDRACYRYVRREASAVNTITAKSLDERLSALKDKTEYLQSRVEPNPYAVMYVARRLDYYLCLHSVISRQPGMEETASRFLSELRELIGKYPGIQTLANQNFTVKALLDYGENLCETPYKSPWGKPQPNDYLDVIARRIGFLEKHPEQEEVELSNTLRLSNWFVKRMRSEGVPKDEIAVYKSCVTSLKRRLAREKETVGFVTNYSIIIPHKDIPDLLQRCLDSIPVRDDVEVIVVDDNSDLEKVEFDRFPQWAGKNYHCFLTKEGRGAGYARNVGLEHATGRWVVFADADDFFTEEFDDLLDEMADAEEDLVFFDYINVLSEDITQQVFNRTWYRVYIANYLNGNKEERELRVLFSIVVSRIIKRELVEHNNIRFSETRWSNDMYFSGQLGYYAQTIRVSGTIGFVITTRKGSLTDDFCSTAEEFRVRLAEVMKCDELLASRYGPNARTWPFLMGVYNRKGLWKCIWLCLANVFHPKIFWKAAPFMLKRAVKNGLRKPKTY